jgi:hypothetical protein
MRICAAIDGNENGFAGSTGEPNTGDVKMHERDEQFLKELRERWREVVKKSEETMQGMISCMVDEGLVVWIDNQLLKLDDQAQKDKLIETFLEHLPETIDGRLDRIHTLLKELTVTQLQKVVSRLGNEELDEEPPQLTVVATDSTPQGTVLPKGWPEDKVGLRADFDEVPDTRTQSLLDKIVTRFDLVLQNLNSLLDDACKECGIVEATRQLCGRLGLSPGDFAELLQAIRNAKARTEARAHG